MVYDVETIKRDIKSLSEKAFYTKHIVKSHNWYFEIYMNKNDADVLHMLDEYRLIIGDAFNISFNSVMMVGSGKVGISLSPPSRDPAIVSKLFQPFSDDGVIRRKSDIDIAIISSELFYEYWKLFRHSYKMQYQSTYKLLYERLYRGYINEKDILEVNGCRKEWNEVSSLAKKNLTTELYFRHEVSFRIYRSWEDFEDYNLQNIRALKRSV